MTRLDLTSSQVCAHFQALKDRVKRFEGKSDRYTADLVAAQESLASLSVVVPVHLREILGLGPIPDDPGIPMVSGGKVLTDDE